MLFIYVPFIGLANLLAGFFLAAPLIQRMGIAPKQVASAHDYLKPFSTLIGAIALIVGIFGLLNRLSLVWIWAYLGGAGYLHILALLAQGLLILGDSFPNIQGLHDFHEKAKPYAEYIGTAGILLGLHATF